MSILKYKYKLHKLVNSLFYVLVFSIGFFTGFLTNKIDFNKVISQFLMIDSVNAYTFYENDNIKIDEDFIYNGFKSNFSDFYIEATPNILCNLVYNTDTLLPNNFYCIATSASSNSSTSLKNITETNYIFLINTPSYYINWIFDPNLNSFVFDLTKQYDFFNYYAFFEGTRVISRTNFDITLASDTHNDLFNTLKFKINPIVSTTNPADSVDEEFIINAFENSFSTFKYIDSPYVTCSFERSFPLNCVAFNQNVFNSLYLKSSSSTSNYISHTDISNATYYSLQINSGLSYLARSSVVNTNLSALPEGHSLFQIFNQEGAYFVWKTFTNFNPSDIDSSMNSINNKTNILDFSEFKEVELTYNENLFANNPDFKKVCVTDNFSITKNTTDGSTSGSDHDYIWFPYGMQGIRQFNYSTESSDGYYPFENPYKNYYFSSVDTINAFWNDEYVSSNFESKGYTDKHSYYGYTAYLFLHWFNFSEDSSYNFFPIFILENPTITHISSNGNIHGGGGFRLDGDEETQLSNEYCFYIKKEYDVNKVIINEWGDFSTSVNTPNGTIDYNTTTNKDNLSNKNDSYFSVVNNFISQIRPTINFINTNIFELYKSMPLIVKSFIISFLVLILVRGLIRMVIK